MFVVFTSLETLMSSFRTTFQTSGDRSEFLHGVLNDFAVATVADEAAAISELCGKYSVGTSRFFCEHDWRTEMLASFAKGFKTEATRLCRTLAEVHLEQAHADTFQTIRLNMSQLSQRDPLDHPPYGVLFEVVNLAEILLADSLGRTSQLCRHLACEAVIQIIMKHWVQQFCSIPAPLSLSSALVIPGSAAFLRAVERDEAMLRALAVKFELVLDACVLQPFQQAYDMLSQTSSTETFAWQQLLLSLDNKLASAWRQ
jgi:hypothetical protein